MSVFPGFAEEAGSEPVMVVSAGQLARMIVKLAGPQGAARAEAACLQVMANPQARGSGAFYSALASKLKPSIPPRTAG